ncbi:glycerophosphodiester phosphodiesterase [Halofilum ochraceum]|uniref:glycerophosphodiester phosphodiesterase n=1 Tax=Halofilum ochraceum TaxID=1611323 RepID=UPI0008308CE4|nr:glycerophosphodiester phosphodiesterase [Halofilum ochraceum]
MPKGHRLASLLVATVAALPWVGKSADQRSGDGIPAFANIAHRGASGSAPEATRPAFEQAVAAGADYLEMDIQMSRDGHLVAIHDTDLDRTTDGSGRVGEHTLAELKALDAGSWFNRAHPGQADPAYAGVQLLTLDEILEAFGTDRRYYIETKSPELYPGVEEKLIETLEAHDLIQHRNVVLQSFSAESLKTLKALNANVPLIQLLWYGLDANGDLVEASGATPPLASAGAADFRAIAGYAAGIGPNVEDGGQRVVDASFVRRAHRAGLLVHVYTVDDTTTMNELIDAGVDGIFTNFPARLDRVLDRRAD